LRHRHPPPGARAYGVDGDLYGGRGGHAHGAMGGGGGGGGRPTAAFGGGGGGGGGGVGPDVAGGGWFVGGGGPDGGAAGASTVGLFPALFNMQIMYPPFGDAWYGTSALLFSFRPRLLGTAVMREPRVQPGKRCSSSGVAR